MTDTSTALLSQSYDAVPYASHPFPQSTPENLEAVAALFGLAACPPAQARVLELGCASGGNLIPFAARHPQARAIGIDLSAVQIQQGQANIAKTGLDNIELRNMNLEEVDASLGQFDYIICHGVYSWVPASVQNAILRIASDNLAPDGIAFVSYNTYPGWKAREIVRDAMLLRGGNRDTPAEQLAYARGMVEFLHDMATDGSVLKKALEDAMPTLQSAKDYYLIHEFLEAFNSPCYLKDFVAAANTHGLAYLGDAEPATMFANNYGTKAAGPLIKECGGSQVLLEQYIDFIVNRQFRQTLLVKQARSDRIRYQLSQDSIRPFEFAAFFQSAEPVTLRDGPIPCKGLRNANVTLTTPIHKAAALVLNAHYPSTLGLPALTEAIGQTLQKTPQAVEAELLGLLSELIVVGATRYRRTPVHLPTSAGEYPRAPALARQVPALQTSPNATVCNAWHEDTTLSVVQQAILPLLDGQHGIEALVAHLVREAQAGHIQFMQQGEKLTQLADMERSAREQLAAALHGLRQSAVLSPLTAAPNPSAVASTARQ